MTDTVLRIAQDAFSATSVDNFQTLTDARNAQSRRARSLLDKSGRSLARMRGAFGQGWAALTREFAFSTVTGQQAYALPDDFAELIDGTVWDRSTYYRARGSLPPQEWQQYKSGLINSVSLTPRYRLVADAMRGRKMLWLDPVPASVESLVLEYIGRNWLRGTDGSLTDRIVSDSDLPIIDAFLLRLDLEWRARRAQGRDFAAELAEFEAERDSRFGSDAGGKTILLGEIDIFGLYPPNIPETGYGDYAL